MRKAGKTTLAKFISYLWGVPICTSSDTYASIRNQLHKIKYQDVEVETNNPEFPNYYKRVETNKGMVWDDIDTQVFINKPDLYRLFKVGYDRSTDKISISSDVKGTNLEFRCFCPKVFSEVWLHQNWILEKPKTKHLKALMAELGMVLDRGYWIKRN